MRPTKEDTRNFLKQELKDLAKTRNASAIVELSAIDVVKAKKIKYARTR